MSQLALPLRLDDHAVFDTFLPIGNEELVEHLKALADIRGGHGAWLWGAPATGKTHLLQATCERFGSQAIYLPLIDVAPAGPQILEGLAGWDVVCVDDITAVAGDHGWEQGLFHLCNELSDTGKQLVVASSASPRESGIQLADLRSRLQRLPTFHVAALDDEQRVAALQLRARHRGVELPDETARYLLTRSARDMRSLYGILDRLDLEALRAQRKLTIPFVRQVLQQMQGQRSARN